MSPNVWVFGYGSLIWNPGFEYSKSIIGKIKGYSRKFYQGSDVHRGSPERLGRVVTLVEDKEASAWGQAFLIKDQQVALNYLGQRESSLGGYTTILTHFYPRDPKEAPFYVLVYIALPCNRLFVGPSPIPQIAQDIAYSKGVCGHNVEYLSRLIAFMKIELPHIFDDHLEELEHEVKSILKRENFPEIKLFTDAIEDWLNRPSILMQEMAEQICADNAEEDEQDFDFKFISSVPDRHLRCMKKF